jgi:competence protein ComEA
MTPASVIASIRTWVGRPLGRAALVLCGLGVLSLVGRFAVAGGQVPPVTTGATATVPPPPAIVPTAAVELDAATPTLATPVTHSRSATEDDPVYINDATLEDLRRLPGVGEKRGLAILELRHKLGRFHHIEELLHVKGIGRATLRRLRPLIRLDAQGDGGAP